MHDIIKQTKTFIETALQGFESGHDIWHAYRVANMARYLAEQENADVVVVEVTALLHDVADWKFAENDERFNLLKNFLDQSGLSKEKITAILDIIENITFKGAKVVAKALSLEGQIVQDADRLDALGAIGIARTFSYGGFKNRTIYDPHIEPMLHDSFESYKKHQGTTINHFYEKLLLLKDKMNTQTAKQIAAKRHQFMELFLTEFMQEWNYHV